MCFDDWADCSTPAKQSDAGDDLNVPCGPVGRPDGLAVAADRRLSW